MAFRTHITESPAGSRRAIAVSVAVFFATLAAAWGVQQLVHRNAVIILGERVTPSGSPFSIRLPQDWVADTGEGTQDDHIFVFRKQVGGHIVGNILLLSGVSLRSPLRSPSGFASECLSRVIGAQGQLVARPEQVAFGPDLAGVQIVANLPGVSVACRATKGPKGNVYALLATLSRPLPYQAGEFLDQIAETIEWNRLRITDDMSGVAQAVGLRFKPPLGSKFALDPQSPIPQVELFTQDATDRGWHMSIHPTFLIQGRQVADLANDQLIDFGWTDQEPRLVDLARAGQAAVIGRQTRLGYVAFWTVPLTNDRAAILRFTAAGDAAEDAETVCRSVAESLTMTKDMLEFDPEAALSVGYAVMDQINKHGLEQWWGAESQTLWYVHWQQGRATQWIKQQRDAVAGKEPDGYHVTQEYYRTNALVQPVRVLNLEWELDAVGMDVDQPSDRDEQYVTMPALDLVTFLMSQESRLAHGLIRVALTQDPSRRFFELCQVLPPQPSAESPGQQEFRVRVFRDYLPSAHVLVFDEQGILIREELDDATITRSTEKEIQKLFLQPKMIRLQHRNSK